MDITSRVGYFRFPSCLNTTECSAKKFPEFYFMHLHSDTRNTGTKGSCARLSIEIKVLQY